MKFGEQSNRLVLLEIKEDGEKHDSVKGIKTENEEKNKDETKILQGRQHLQCDGRRPSKTAAEGKVERILRKKKFVRENKVGITYEFKGNKRV